MSALKPCGLVLLSAIVCTTAKITPVQVSSPALGGSVQLTVAAAGTFRVSIRLGNSTAPMTASDSPMITAQKSLPAFTNISDSGMVGVKSAFGSVLFNPTSGAFLLKDASDKVLTSASSLFTPNDMSLRSIHQAQLTASCNNSLSGRTDCQVDGQGPCEAAGCCWSPVNPNPSNLPWCFKKSGPPPPPSPPPPPGKCTIYPGMDISSGSLIAASDETSEAACCAKCTADTTCDVFVFAPAGHESGGDNCWMLQGVSSLKYAQFRDVGYVRGPKPLTPPPPPPQTTLTLNASAMAKYYGAGTGRDAATTLSMTQSSPHVQNTEFFTSHYWSSDGYGLLAVTDAPYAMNDITSYPAGWSASTGNVVWTVDGHQIDLYFMPGDQPTALSSLWDVTGRPAIPPRYALGFMACRWGWKDANYITQMLTAFRNGSYPIDAFISDFEWFTITPDYSLPNSGSPTYTDFGYNNVTFPQPSQQLAHYKDDLNMVFGGIRKPRLGNSDLLVMARSKNWTLNDGSRNLNYSIPELRDWYMEQHVQYLKDGVQFWWNDEGETFYFAFYWWNVAQKAGLAAFDAAKRFWTINRSYSPGMSRLGAVLWTGDISVSWDSLAEQPGYVLNWLLAGVGFVTCDTGGFSGSDTSPLLLTRWYQFAAFMPVMRVHSTHDDTPHFPFLYGPEAGDAMRKALNLRYQFLPYHYSLAHAAYNAGGIPIMRPLLWSYPDDPIVAEMTDQWFDGEHLMIAPILNEQNSSNVYLPAGQWYEWNTTTTHQGGQNLTAQNVALDYIPVYVRPGAIVPLGPVIQYAAQSPGGALQVNIYSGADGSFTLVEDDGETYSYETGTDVRSTQFSWDDSTSTLTWTVTGTYTDCWLCYTDAEVTVFSSAGTAQAKATLGASGSVVVKSD